MADHHVQEDDLVLHCYGETTAAEESRVAAHLAGCAACGDAYRRLQRVRTAVESGAATNAPPDGCRC